MGSNPSHFRGDNLPVEKVSWSEVQEFISKLNVKTGKKYRLPTEAEWEYAARGGSSGTNNYVYAGSNRVTDVAMYKENSGVGRTFNVGVKAANELGLYDMSGNVSEWTGGKFETYSQKGVAGQPSGSSRIYRGGSWNDDTGSCRVSARSHALPSFRRNFIGFRLALDP
jgi:formylglycine-generating enzyme required for sulfatase activity